MKQVVVDCRTGQVFYLDLTPVEENRRLQEIEIGRGREAAEKKEATKRQLVTELAELREMKEYPLIFSSSEVAGKQARISDLQATLVLR